MFHWGLRGKGRHFILQESCRGKTKEKKVIHKRNTMSHCQRAKCANWLSSDTYNVLSNLHTHLTLKACILYRNNNTGNRQRNCGKQESSSDLVGCKDEWVTQLRLLMKAQPLSSGGAFILALL